MFELSFFGLTRRMEGEPPAKHFRYPIQMPDGRIDIIVFTKQKDFFAYMPTDYIIGNSHTLTDKVKRMIKKFYKRTKDESK
jgi:hypothetical protein